MSEKRVRFAKFDPRISLSATRPIQTSYVQKASQFCENCGFYQQKNDINDPNLACKKCLVTNKILKPRASPFSKSEQNLSKLTNATNNQTNYSSNNSRSNINLNIELPIEITKYLQKKSKEFESIDERAKQHSPKKFNSFHFKTEPRSNELVWKCFKCNEAFEPGELAVSAEPVFDTFSRWHIKCFVCCTCNNVLVDLLYFCKDKKLYCKKHYCSLINDQIVAPSTPSIVCAACDQAIESSEYIKAENKFWHFDHFTCWGCEKSLGSKRYIVVDSKPYCFDCHLVHYSKKCQTCQQRIQQDITRLTYENLDWHAQPECFKCYTCQKSLLETHFLLKKNLLFCSIECKKKTSII